jgi:hypothetical protein
MLIYDTLACHLLPQSSQVGGSGASGSNLKVVHQPQFGRCAQIAHDVESGTMS